MAMNWRTYDGRFSLNTTDNCVEAALVKDVGPRLTHKAIVNAEVLYKQGRTILATIEDVLSPEICKQIIQSSNKISFEKMTGKYTSEQRNNSRALVLDESLASGIWNIIRPEVERIMDANGIPYQPLGFGVSEGKWELEGLNPAFRINKYSSEKNEFFSLHKDAQYCPNGDRRSIFTLIIYLNDAFDGGSTNYYFIKDENGSKAGNIQNAFHFKSKTVKEEVESAGGIETGYIKYNVKPAVGKAVFFSQNILHESVPLIKGHKILLKTDIVVQRKEKKFGFALLKSEKKDYLECLNYFRQAQQEELDRNFSEAGELYEKALSIRYCYPEALNTKSKSENSDRMGIISTFPSIVWYQIFDYLSGYDMHSLLKAYPDLAILQKSWESQRFKHDEKVKNMSKIKFIPSVETQYGIYTKFIFSDPDFFFKNEHGCLRVAAMYAFFLLGHKKNDYVYPVRYNPETQEVCAISLKSLLTSAFLNQRCYGSIYAVRQMDPNKKQLEKDFVNSVDKSYMACKHGAQSLGTGLLGRFETKIHLLANVELSASEDDSCSDMDDSASDADNSDCDDSNPIEKSNDNDDCEKKDGEEQDTKLQGRDIPTSGSTHEDAHHKNGSLTDSVDTVIPITANDSDDKTTLCENFLTDIPYSGYEESDNSDADDNIEGEISPEDSNYEIIKEYLRSKEENDDILVYGYDCNFYPRCASSTFKYIINDSTATRKFQRLGLEIPDDTSEYISEKTSSFVDSGGDVLDNEIELYMDGIAKKAAVSATLVSVLKKPTTIGSESMCLCYWPGGDGFQRIRRACKTTFYNHLVFDFLENEMKITKVENNLDERKCFFKDNFNAFIAGDYNDMLTKFNYRIDLTEILTDDMGFNHASCNCHLPAFKIDEYCNLKDYPHLDHIHLVGGEADGHVVVWAIYGGIVAL